MSSAAILAKWRKQTQPIQRVPKTVISCDPFANATPCHQQGCSYILFTGEQLFHTNKRTIAVLVTGLHTSNKGVGL